MTDITDYRATLMGDILFTVDVTCTITLTVAGPTVYADSVNVAKGTWFASPLHFMQYLVSEWNASIPGGQMSVTFVSDPEDANYRKLAFVPETGLGTVTQFNIAIPTYWSEFGLSSASTNLGAGSSTKYSPSAVPNTMTLFWPVASYNRRVDTVLGYSEYAEDGTIYSTAGPTQDVVELSFALDRYQDYSEPTYWRGLWLTRWSVGRSVAFYLDNATLPTSWSTSLGDGLSLVSEKVDSLDFERMVDRTEAIDYTRVHGFLVRQSRLIDSYNRPTTETGI